MIYTPVRAVVFDVHVDTHAARTFHLVYFLPLALLLSPSGGVVARRSTVGWKLELAVQWNPEPAENPAGILPRNSLSSPVPVSCACYPILVGSRGVGRRKDLWASVARRKKARMLP
ncbi:hypothetical protein B0T22DRAFT_451416 [Podospora appendiculata]|uniref:Uncharacterized protein n=1 Tax=Podospora appendiculata TaxID=314037 RepID=A0AAE1CGR8_9PEZI|nr:hypothetical protein B0T22DRAFT_451416 [Podospora appendiculata]